MAGYVFISNSSKPTGEQSKRRDDVHPTNVSIPCLKAALDLGFDVYLGTNREKPEELKCNFPVKLYDSHTYRSIIAFKDNVIAYKNLCKVIKEGNIKAIHCNTPIGGMIGRICGKRMHVDKVIYTAHGFHFYKDAPLFNRTILKWAEQIMAHWTDAIITMNQEDYEAAQKFKLRNKGKVYYVPGVGLDLSVYDSNSDAEIGKREELGIDEDKIIIISSGELNKNKNNKVILSALAELRHKNICYVICGTGGLEDELKQLCRKLDVEDRVIFLGYRDDMKELLCMSDIFLMSSYREGLSRSIMEAMAMGKPCIVSDIRGNRDLVDDGKGGYLIKPDDSKGFACAIDKLAEDKEMRLDFGLFNKEKIKEFGLNKVCEEMKNIYQGIF